MSHLLPFQGAYAQLIDGGFMKDLLKTTVVKVRVLSCPFCFCAYSLYVVENRTFIQGQRCSCHGRAAVENC